MTGFNPDSCNISYNSKEDNLPVIDNMMYSIDTVNQTATLIKDLGKDVNVTIPATIIVDEVEYSVLIIDSYAFSNNDIVESVIISDGITTINNYAFNNCSKLKSVIQPGSVTTLSQYSYNNCPIQYSYDFKGYTIKYYVKAGETKSIYFTPTETGTYTIQSVSGSDTYGYLYLNGSSLTSNDDSGDGNNFSFNYSLTAGVTYEIRIKFYSTSNAGVLGLLITK